MGSNLSCRLFVLRVGKYWNRAQLKALEEKKILLPLIQFCITFSTCQTLKRNVLTASRSVDENVGAVLTGWLLRDAGGSRRRRNWNLFSETKQDTEKDQFSCHVSLLLCYKQTCTFINEETSRTPSNALVVRGTGWLTDEIVLFS